MNSKYQWKGIGRVFALLSISAALAACDGSTGSTTSNEPSISGTPASSSPSSTANTSSSDTGSSTPAAGSGSSTSGSGSTLPPATSDSVTLSWSAPSENTNGSALINLAGYEIYYGTSPSALTQEISINTVGILTYVVSNLSSGTWYFEVVAVNSSGVPSAPSSVVSTTI